MRLATLLAPTLSDLLRITNSSSACSTELMPSLLSFDAMESLQSAVAAAGTSYCCHLRTPSDTSWQSPVSSHVN